MDNSYWISSVKDNKKEYKKLQGEIETEIAIIGGGLTGLSCGYYLSKENKDVVILEKNTICSHTSGNTTGKITSGHGLFYNYLLQSEGRDKAKQYLDANEKAIENIAKIVEEENIKCDFERQDAYIFTQKQEEVEKIEKEVEALEYLDFSCELVKEIPLPIKDKGKESTENYISIEKKVLAAIKYKNQAQFNPCLYAEGLANKIEERKGKIFENTKVLDVKKNEEGYEVITDDAKVNAKIVILASHYPIITFPGFYFMKMYQEISYLIGVETNEPLFEGMYINTEEPTISLRTAKYGDKRLLLVGGMKHKTGAKIDLKDSYKKLEEVAKSLYPDSKVLYRWNTEDCISLDKIPYIGEFSNLMPNVYVATGYKKWGMTSSNIAANIITDKILGRENNYEEVFNSTRLKPIKNHEELGNILKEVNYSLVVNKLKNIEEYVKDVKQGEGKIIEIDGQKVGAYRNEKGELFLIKPYCSHLGCMLSWNNLDKTWDCPCHGSRFNYEGKQIYDPAIKDLEKIDIEK